MLMTNQQAAKLSQPCVGPLDDPSPFVASEFSSIFITPFLVVLAVRRNQFDASLFQAPTQRVGIVAAVGNHALRPLPRTALRLRDADFGERGFRSVTSAGEALSSRTPSGTPSPSASTIHFVPLPRLVLPTARPLFLRGRNCRRERSRPSAACHFRPAPPAAPAKLPARRLRPASVAIVASRSRAKEIRRAKIARPRRF